MKISLRNKLASICFSTTVFSGLALIIVNLAGGPLARAAIIVPIIGFSIGMFEEFYVRGRPGRWLRSMHPAKSVLIYSLLIVGFHVILMMTARLLSGPYLDAAAAAEQVNTIPPILIVLPAMIPVSAAAIMLLRIVGYFRELAAELEMSLGKINYCLKAFVNKGYIKVNNFRRSDNKLAYAYILTPHGLEEKARVTVCFFRRVEAEYETLKLEMEYIRQQTSTKSSYE